MNSAHASKTAVLSDVNGDGIRREVRFIDAGGRRLFCYLRSPLHQPPRAWVLHLPAFADEMNKSRHMVTQTAESLAASGFGVAIFDLSGTGDSSGEFEAARLEHWHDDIRAVCEVLGGEAMAPIIPWSLRSGNLLLSALESGPFDAAVMWQPMTSGRELVHQTLRLRVMSSRMDGEGESAKQLRALLEQGEVLEVGGYGLHPELVSALEALAFPLPDVDLLWLDVSSADALPPPRQKLADALPRPPRLELLGGEPFWATAEIATAPELIAATRDFLGQRYSS